MLEKSSSSENVAAIEGSSPEKVGNTECYFYEKAAFSKISLFEKVCCCAEESTSRK